MRHTVAVKLVQRLLLLLTQVAWALPFVVVTDCGTSTRHMVGGWQVYDALDTQVLWIGLPLVLALLLAWKPWRPGAGIGSGAAGLGLRALGAGLGLGISSIGPGLAFLFDRVQPHVGWAVQLLGWALLGLGYLGGAVRALVLHHDGPASTTEGRAGALLVLVAPIVSAVVALALGRRDWGNMLVTGVLVGPPLALVVIGVGRRVKARQEGAGRWRAAAVALLGLWVLFCVGVVVR